MVHPLEWCRHTIRVIHFQLFMGWYVCDFVFKIAEMMVDVLHINVLPELLFNQVPSNSFQKTLCHKHNINACFLHIVMDSSMHLPHSVHVLPPRGCPGPFLRSRQHSVGVDTYTPNQCSRRLLSMTNHVPLTPQPCHFLR